MILRILLCAVLVGVSAWLVRWMVRWGALDHPGARSSHDRPTPKGGGVGIVAAVVLGALIGPFCAFVVTPALLCVVLAGAALAGFSYLDDLRSFSPLSKLAMQVAVAIVPVVMGIVLPNALFGFLPSSVAGVVPPLCTVIVILLITNAVNFMDGLNGLASGAVAISALAAALFLGANDAGFVGAGAVFLVCGIAGFLPFNFPRAKIFMGDVGSQFLGFVIAVIGVRAAQLNSVSATLVPMCLFPMLVDVVFTLLRRAIAGQRLMQAHRGHLYQLAQRALMPAWLVTAMHWAMAGFGAWLWIVSKILQIPNSVAVFTALILIQVMWAVRVLAAAIKAPIGPW